VRFALAIVLGLAALSKARSFGAFRLTVGELLPWRRGVSAAAAAVVATEAALAGLLAAGVLATAVAAATLALFAGFAALSWWAQRRGLRVQCNCFGRSERELGRESFLTSALLAGATVVYLLLLPSVDSLALGELPLVLGLSVAAVLGGRWLLAAGELAGLVRQRRLLDGELAQPAPGASR